MSQTGTGDVPTDFHRVQDQENRDRPEIEISRVGQRPGPVLDRPRPITAPRFGPNSPEARLPVYAMEIVTAKNVASPSYSPIYPQQVEADALSRDRIFRKRKTRLRGNNSLIGRWYPRSSYLGKYTIAVIHEQLLLTRNSRRIILLYDLRECGNVVH